MLVQGIDCAVLYVDPGASGLNDGSSPANALNTLPDPDSWAGSTVYLVRRGTADLTLLDGTVTNENTYLMGMPKSGEPFYNVVPTAAKSAWDGDAANYANFSSSAGDGITYNASYGGVFGCYFKQTRHTAEYSFFEVLSGNQAHFMIKCRIEDPSYDLETVNTTSSSELGQIKFRDWAVVQDVYFQRPMRTGDINRGADAYAIEFLGRNSVCEDVELWYQTSNYDSSSSGNVSGIGFTYATGSNVTTRNITIKVVYQTSSNDIGSFYGFNIANGNVVKIRNLDVSVAREVNTTGTGIRMNYMVQVSMYSAGENALDIDGITMDQGNFNWGGPTTADTDLFIRTYWFGSSVGGSESYIRNITMNQTTVTTTNTTYVRKVLIQCNSKTFIENCTFGFDNKTKAEISTQAGSQNDEPGPRCRGLTIRGAFEADHLSFCEVDSMDVGIVDSNPINVIDGICHIKQATLPAWDTTNVINTTGRSWCFVDSLNTELYYTGSGSSYPASPIYVNNINGVQGRWEGHVYSFDAETVNVFRTGGASAAIKFTGQRIDDDPLWIGPEPYPAMRVKPGSTGQKTLTVYVAYKGYTTENDVREFFNILVDYPTGGGSDFKRVTSVSEGVWRSDTSTWNNDSGLTLKRCEFTIDVDRVEDIEVRMAFNWFEGSAYFYLDPLVQIS